MKARNHNVYNDDQNVINALADEYRDYCGRDVVVYPNHLVVLAYKPKKVVKKKDDKKDEDKRNERGRRPQASKVRE